MKDYKLILYTVAAAVGGVLSLMCLSHPMNLIGAAYFLFTACLLPFVGNNLPRIRHQVINQAVADGLNPTVEFQRNGVWYAVKLGQSKPLTEDIVGDVVCYTETPKSAQVVGPK